MDLKEKYSLDDLLQIMAALRDPKSGCPWDVEQTFKSIAPYTIEEAYEVVDAIENENNSALKEELGDLLLQVVFHAQMAKEKQLFHFDDVVHTVADKMISRHPHVFGDGVIEDAAAQTIAWEQQKAAERVEKAKVTGEYPSVLDGVALGLPALMRAIKLQNRAAKVGFDWPQTAQVLEKITEESLELSEALVAAKDTQDKNMDAIQEEFGDLLFVYANLARHLNIDPEEALRNANAKFERRFKGVEQALKAKNSTCENSTLEEMDALWNEVKAQEKG